MQIVDKKKGISPSSPPILGPECWTFVVIVFRTQIMSARNTMKRRIPGLNIYMKRRIPGLNIYMTRRIPGLNIYVKRIPGLNISMKRRIP